MSFEFPLAEEKVKKQQIIALHLIVSFSFIITGILMLLFHYLQHLTAFKNVQLLLFRPSKWQGWSIIIPGVALLFIVMLKSRFLMQPNVNRITRIVELLVISCFALIAGIHELLVPAGIYTLIAAAILFAIYWETVSDNTLYIIVDERGIKLPVTSRKRILQWWEVQQVLFRFGILTIDCYDNRLFQWNIRNVTLDKEAFQRFCTEQITANSEKHQKNNW